MSHIGWIPRSPGEASRPGRFGWRWFPWAVAAGMSVVIAVNIGMVYAALSSFPGSAGNNEFELSNHYDAVLERVQHEASLGWSVAAQPDGDRRAVVTLTERSGAPLRGAVITGTAERPLGAAETRQLMFRETEAGHYVADVALPLAGQWELELSASAEGQQIVTTRRIYVR